MSNISLTTLVANLENKAVETHYFFDFITVLKLPFAERSLQAVSVCSFNHHKIPLWAAQILEFFIALEVKSKIKDKQDRVCDF